MGAADNERRKIHILSCPTFLFLVFATVLHPPDLEHVKRLHPFLCLPLLASEYIYIYGTNPNIHKPFPPQKNIFLVLGRF